MHFSGPKATGLKCAGVRGDAGEAGRGAEREGQGQAHAVLQSMQRRWWSPKHGSCCQEHIHAEGAAHESEAGHAMSVQQKAEREARLADKKAKKEEDRRKKFAKKVSIGIRICWHSCLM
jgi:hypothetical protein